MSKDGKYSILFMRDDTHVRRFRVSPRLMRGMAWGAGILLLAAVLSVGAGIRFWAAGARLGEEKKALERRLIEAEVRLERLSNVEKILKSNDPEDLHALIGGGAAAPAGVKPQAQGKGQAAAAPAQPDQGRALNLAELFEHQDTKLAGLENVQLKISGETAQLRLDLNNLQPEKLLNGRVDLLLIATSGKVEAAGAPEADLTFSIQRFKRIQTSFALPSGMQRNDLFALRVVIKGQDGKAIFSETYQLARILAS